MQELHETTGAGGVVAHEVSFGGPHLSQCIPFGLVVHIGRAGEFPGRTALGHNIFDSEMFEQRVEPATTQPGAGFEFGHGLRCAIERTQQQLDVFEFGDRRGGEELPDGFIGLGGKQHRLRVGEVATGATDLLVVRHRRCG